MRRYELERERLDSTFSADARKSIRNRLRETSKSRPRKALLANHLEAMQPPAELADKQRIMNEVVIATHEYAAK